MNTAWSRFLAPVHRPQPAGGGQSGEVAASDCMVGWGLYKRAPVNRPITRLVSRRSVHVLDTRIRANGNSRSRRSEEHTSELQSLMRISYAVFCLKQKNKQRNCQSVRSNTSTHETHA